MMRHNGNADIKLDILDVSMSTRHWQDTWRNVAALGLKQTQSGEIQLSIGLVINPKGTVGVKTAPRSVLNGKQIATGSII